MNLTIQDDERYTDFGRTRITRRMQRMIGEVNWQVKGPKLLLLTCLLITAGMLVAGLWPFRSPKNHVTWLAGGRGLHFGRHGTVLSSGEFRVPGAATEGPCSLEIWIEPDLTWTSGVMMSVYAPDRRRQFSLRQSKNNLALQSDIFQGLHRPLTNHSYVMGVLQGGKECFVTLTSNGRQTLLYVNGARAQTSSDFPLSSRDFSGELILATLPRGNASWRGVWRGLAIYGVDLSPAQVVGHYETWTKTGRPHVAESERPAAMYRFDEGAGRIIRNQVPSGLDLHIPERFLLVDQAFLTPFWEEYEPSRSYWVGDVLFNIAGFVPFGFLVCAYLSLALRVGRPALITILLGFTLSLTIECTQGWLPTRDSGTSDLITNTLGTCLGVWAYRLSLWRVPAASIWTSLVGG